MRVGDVPVVPYYRPGDDRIAEALAGLAPAITPFTGQPRTGGYWLIAARSHQQYRGTGRDRTADFTLGNREIRYLTADEVKELR